MTHAPNSNMFAGITDQSYLRAAVDVLGGLAAEIEQHDPQVISDTPGVDAPRVAGLRAVREMALCRQRWALDQYDRLYAVIPAAQPVVLDPAELAAVESVQGQPLTPVITAGAAHTRGLSSAKVWMPPGHRARAHVHHHTDIGVVVLEGTAITLWWDQHGTQHEIPQRAGQHLHIPPGIPHAAINPSPHPVIALEFRGNPVFNTDTECIELLDADVAARLPALAA